jgi:glycosyltransferase involved in cell wall biosynthesis
VAAVPDARLRVTGEPPPEIRQFVTDRSIEFLGLVPDLYDVYNAARVAVVPLRYGAGLSMKSFEALKFGVPVVATTVGAADLDSIAPGAVWTADTDSAFADAVVASLTMRDQWNAQRSAILESLRSRPASARHQWRAVLENAQLARVTRTVA